MTITPKNWSEFQHYKNRSPIWIKLHRTLLNNYEFHRLPVASKALAPMLWLLASEYDRGQITAPMDAIAFRLRMSLDELNIALKPLIDADFFTVASKPLAKRQQTACLEKEKRQRQRKKEPNQEDNFISRTQRVPPVRVVEGGRS